MVVTVLETQKDWRGNTKTTFTTLGASNHSKSDRQKVDFYATDPNALSIFLERIKTDNLVLPSTICEPSCGAGHLSEELIKHGFTVDSYDLYDHGYGVIGEDFLKSNRKYDCFLTNPPYKYALEFVNHAIENLIPNGLVIMLLRIQFLEGQRRNEFFKKYPPKYIYVNSRRQNCAKNGDFKKYFSTSAICYAWFVWQEGFKGEPKVRWID